MIYIDAKKLYGHSRSQALPYDVNKFDKSVKLEDFLNTPGISDIGYFVEVDLTYPDNMKEKSKHFPFALENKEVILITSLNE